ncbi:MAG: AMP-binding protein [Roseivirga sp.]|nr:AMP-binding protein [Roseivirga sp.]
MYPNLWRYLQKQAAYYSNKPFATFGKEELSFDELLSRVKRLSIFLGTSHKCVIGIDLAHPLQGIPAIFATLVSGKAFWSTNSQLIDQTEPAVLEDVFLLNESQYTEGVSHLSGDFEVREEMPAEAPFCWTTSSGGLAATKITEHSYYSILEDTIRQVEAHEIGSEDNIDVISSLSFSASLSSIFPALLSGASLHIYNNASLAITGIYEFWKYKRITMTTLIPTMFRPLLNYQYDFSRLDIRFICLGGEPVYVRDIALFQKKFPRHSKLQVAIASSEARSIAEYISETDTPLPKKEIPYSPIPEKELSIVDTGGQPLSYGRIAITSKVMGTRYIQGPDSFSESENGDRIFISDDEGQIDANGKLILGNASRARLKLKGEFVDLDQLEQTILREDNIFDCRADLSGRGSVLRLFIHSVLKKNQVRRLLTDLLQTQSFQLYVFNEKLPKTHSGKPDIEGVRKLIQRDRNAEYSDKDLNYYEQWHRVFPAETEFDGKHFFKDLGGDSISAAVLSTLLNKAFDVEIEPNAIYMNPRYGELFDYLENTRPYLLKNIGGFNSQNPNILFFPSMYVGYEHYLPIVDLLEENYNSFLIQYTPGSGKRYESPDSIAKKCSQLLKNSSIGFSCFIGHSFAGYLAYSTASQANSNVGVVMLDTHTYQASNKRRKKVSNWLRATQLLYQHIRKPKQLGHIMRRRFQMTKSRHSSKTADRNQAPESRHRAGYDNFFNAFELSGERPSQADFPLGIIKASNSSNIRYRLEYDYKWHVYNNNIKLNQTLPGEHKDFLYDKDNIGAIANLVDRFMKQHCQ